MRLTRLFIDVPLEPGREVALPAAAAGHAVRVLRLDVGDTVRLFNGDAHDYPARLLATGSSARVRVEGIEANSCESPLQVTLVQALARGEKMDWIVQKATELGVARIVPVTTERSGVRLDPARARKRLEHWRAVAVAACEQCGRNVLPHIDAPAALGAWLGPEGSAAPMPRLMLAPDGGMSPRDLTSMQAATLAVGPEGGFGEDDLATLRGAGFAPLTLGPRVLRTETAGIAAIAALQALFGDL